jgi:hypothetical protein
MRARRSLRSADGGGGAEAAAQDGSWGEADAEVELGEEDRRAFTGRTLHVVSRLKARSFLHPRLSLNPCFSLSP